MISNRRWRCALVMSLWGVPLLAQEDPVPEAIVLKDYSRLEAGVLAAGAYLPDYPAAGQSHFKFFGAPYIIYRGKILRADREGARARLVRGQYYDLEMSFAASFATHSKDNEAREGMPDLDYMLELGPRLSIPLSDLGGLGRLRLFLPLRAVFSTDFGNFKHRGYSATPALYARFNDFLKRDWIAILQLTANFADRPLSAYFYDVAPEFALPTRPFYDARGGYLGSDLFAGAAIPLGGRWRLFTGLQLLYHGGSANRASPLFRRDTNFSTIAGLSYMFYQSTKRADPL